MNEQEIQTVKWALAELTEALTELTRLRTEVEYRIEALRNVKERLERLLPTEDRINRLFGR